MNQKQFKAFLNLLMCSDPWPTPNQEEQALLIAYANQEAEKYGFDSWIDAYHKSAPPKVRGDCSKCGKTLYEKDICYTTKDSSILLCEECLNEAPSRRLSGIWKEFGKG